VEFPCPNKVGDVKVNLRFMDSHTAAIFGPACVCEFNVKPSQMSSVGALSQPELLYNKPQHDPGFGAQPMTGGMNHVNLNASFV
jgi:hypothetical protein